MKHLRSIIVSSGSLFVAAMLAATSAQGSDKTYAAFGGNDANDCFSPPTACHSLQRAVNQTNPRGTVVVDPPSYNAGTAVINKPLTILFNGNQSDSPLDGSPPNPTGNLIINTGNGDDTVTIDGLNMNLLGANRNGIQVNSGSLDLRGSTIQNVGGTTRSGIFFTPDTNGRLYISNSTISNAPFGITVDGRSGAFVKGTWDDVRILDTGTGIRSIPGAGSRHDLVLQRCTVSGNNIGAQSNTNRSNILIGNSTITGNGIGLSRPNGGKITSLTGNTFIINTTNGSFSGTVNPQ